VTNHFARILAYKLKNTTRSLRRPEYWPDQDWVLR